MALARPMKKECSANECEKGEWCYYKYVEESYTKWDCKLRWSKIISVIIGVSGLIIGSMIACYCYAKQRRRNQIVAIRPVAVPPNAIEMRHFDGYNNATWTQPGALPSGWGVATDPQGRNYYYHLNGDGYTQWTFPQMPAPPVGMVQAPPVPIEGAYG